MNQYEFATALDSFCEACGSLMHTQQRFSESIGFDNKAMAEMRKKAAKGGIHKLIGGAGRIGKSYAEYLPTIKTCTAEVRAAGNKLKAPFAPPPKVGGISGDKWRGDVLVVVGELADMISRKDSAPILCISEAETIKANALLKALKTEARRAAITIAPSLSKPLDKKTIAVTLGLTVRQLSKQGDRYPLVEINHKLHQLELDGLTPSERAKFASN